MPPLVDPAPPTGACTALDYASRDRLGAGEDGDRCSPALAADGRHHASSSRSARAITPSACSRTWARRSPSAAASSRSIRAAGIGRLAGARSRRARRSVVGGVPARRRRARRRAAASSCAASASTRRAPACSTRCARWAAHIEIADERLVGGEPVADLVLHGAARCAASTSPASSTVRAIDELPLLAAVAAHADGDDAHPRRRRAARQGVGSHRRHAPRCCARFGVEVEERPDGLTRRAADAARSAASSRATAITASPWPAPSARSAPPARRSIHDTDNVATSFPGFAPALAALGADLGHEVR